VRWFVNVGDHVKPDELIAEVQTDKAVVEMTTPVGGKVIALAGEEGHVVSVGEALITVDRGDAASAPSNTENIEKQGQSDEQPTEHEQIKKQPKRVIAAPVVRKRARELG